MPNDNSTLILDSPDNKLLNPLPFGGVTSPVVPDITASGTGDVALQGSPVTRLMGPPDIDGPAEEKSNMKNDTDGPMDYQKDENGDPLDDTLGPRNIDPTVSRDQSPKYKVGVTDITAVEQQRISALVPAEELAKLSTQISELYKLVAKDMARSREHAAQAFTWLNDARRILIGSPGLYTLAELQINQTRLLLKQVQTSEADAKIYQTRLISWNLFWLALFIGLFAFDGAITNWLQSMDLVNTPAEFTNPELPFTPTPSLVWYFQPWLCALVGGIGGALAAITVLGRSISRREYDSALNLDYYLNAIKGLVLGGVVYYILLGGFITIATTTTLGNDVGDLVQRVQVAGSPLFILMGFMAGFTQQRILSLLPQVWGNVTGSGEKTDEDTLNVRQATVEAVPLGAQSFAMGSHNQLPDNARSYNGNNVPPISHPSAAPDNAYYQDDPTASPNGQNDFVPFPNAGP